MAIDRTGITSLESGAPEITYSGNEGPQDPRAMTDIDKIILQHWIQQGGSYGDVIPEEFKQQIIQIYGLDKMASVPEMAYGGSANPTYTQKRKQQLAGGGIAGLKQIGKPGGRVEPGIMKYGMLDFITEPLGKLKDKIVDDLIPNEIKENPMLSAAVAGLALDKWGLPFDIGNIVKEGAGKNWIGDLLGNVPGVEKIGEVAKKVGQTIIPGGDPGYDLGKILSGDGGGGGGLMDVAKQTLATILPGGDPGYVEGGLYNKLLGIGTGGTGGTGGTTTGQNIRWKEPLVVGLGIGALDKATRKDQSLPAQTGIDIPAIRTAALAGEAPARAAGLYFTPKDETRLPSNQGGRIRYSGGGNGNGKDDSMVGITMSIEERWERIQKMLKELEDIKKGKGIDPDPEDKAQGGRIGYANGGSNITLSDGTIVQIPAGSIGKYGLKDRIYESSKGSLLREDIIPLLNPGLTFNQGGRVPAQEGGLMDLGGMEKDYRNEGGFVPIGGQERADDVPARLSKNEFVFTADAVRAAGGGDIDRGAEVMENVMENLEQGGQVSEESQGLEGARDMFATSQRLEGVL